MTTIAYAPALQRAARQPRPLMRSAVSSRTAVQLTRRGRLAVAVVALLSLVLLGFVAAGAVQAGSPEQAPRLREVVVQPGQSLWGFARSSLPGMDPREAVLRIREINGLGGSVIHPGQVLRVPATR